MIRSLDLRALLALPTIALLLAGCGSKELALPDEPVDRAATCGVVDVIGSRLAIGAKGDLPFDHQLEVMHYAMLAAVDGDGFSRERASQVSQRMGELADPLTEGDKWKTLEAPCGAAYPATRIADPKLPANAADAQLGCYVLSDFVTTALGGAGTGYGEDLVRLGTLRRALDTKIGARFGAAGAADAEAQKAAKDKALAGMATAGPPAKLLKQCEAKYAA